MYFEHLSPDRVAQQNIIVFTVHRVIINILLQIPGYKVCTLFSDNKKIRT